MRIGTMCTCGAAPRLGAAVGGGARGGPNFPPIITLRENVMVIVKQGKTNLDMLLPLEHVGHDVTELVQVG